MGSILDFNHHTGYELVDSRRWAIGCSLRRSRSVSSLWGQLE